MDTIPHQSGNTHDRSRTILIVEDSLTYRQLLRHYLHQDNRYIYTILETETVGNGYDEPDSAIARSVRNPPNHRR